MTASKAKLLALALLTTGAAFPAVADPPPESDVVHEILGILKQRGIVDEGEYQRLSARYAETEQKRGWLDRISFDGDFRARYEAFWFNPDATGDESSNRQRGRYRLRLGAHAEVTDWARVHVKLASGQDDNRSTNQTLGNGVDFDPDQIFIDQAYAELLAPKSWISPERGQANLNLGKMPNPFVWKVGKDFMLWDNDINPEGVGLTVSGRNEERRLGAFVNSGVYVLDENSSSKDPVMIGAQAGGEWGAAEGVVLGARASYFGFQSLDPDFLCRGAFGTNTAAGVCDGTGSSGATEGGGNIVDPATGASGLTGDLIGDGGFNVIEVAGYLQWRGVGAFPVAVYGNWSENLNAKAVDFGVAGTVDEEDNAWGVGLEVGDKKKYAMVGAGYWHIEANAFPSQFIDSDLFDGFTNREGWAFYGSRQVWKNTDLNVTLFKGDDIENTPLVDGAFLPSAESAKRWRLQTDLVLKF